MLNTDDYTMAFNTDLPPGGDGDPDPYLGEATLTNVFLSPTKETDTGLR